MIIIIYNSINNTDIYHNNNNTNTNDNNNPKRCIKYFKMSNIIPPYTWWTNDKPCIETIVKIIWNLKVNRMMNVKVLAYSTETYLMGYVYFERT